MKQLLFCLTLLFITLPASSKDALHPPVNNDVKQAQFLTKNMGLKNQTIISLNTENSSERANAGTGNESSKPAGNSERVGVGTGGGIVKRFDKSKRLGEGTGSKPKPGGS
jgi:hypothetical protein